MIPCYLDYFSFTENLDIQCCQSSDFVLLKYLVGSSGFFAFPFKIQTDFVDIHKINITPEGKTEVRVPR